MLKYSNGRLLVTTLYQSVSNKKGGQSNNETGVFIEELIGKWTKFKLVFDTSKSPTISVYLNDKKILDNVEFWIQRCGVPHFKFGIYRPGNKSHPNARSVVDFDKFQLKVLDKDFRRTKRELNYCFYGGVQQNGSYERQVKLADLWLEDPGPEMRLYSVTLPDKCEEGHEEIAEGQYRDLKARWRHKELNYCFDGGFQKNVIQERQKKLVDVLVWGPSPEMRVYAVTSPKKCEEGHEEIAEGQYEDLKARIDSYKKE